MTVGAAKGSFRGQPQKRTWTLSVRADHAPRQVSVSGERLSAHAYRWDADTGRLTITLPSRGVHRAVTVTY